MKFLHTSDWHIGRQLHNQSLLDDQRYVLDQIVALAIQNKVDAVVVAGDIYDRAIPAANAVALLSDVLNRLVHDAGIAVIMIAGNHDSHERLGFAAQQMVGSGLHIVGPMTDPIQTVAIKDAIFYGLPYADPATVRDVFGVDVHSHEEAMSVLLEHVKTHDSQGLAKVVVSHCFIDGGSESDSERPLSIGGADRISASLFKPFDYVALGHLHGPQYKGEEHIRYSGSILKYSFSEQHHNKSVCLVELGSKGEVQTSLLPLRAKRDVRIIEAHLEEILAQGVSDAGKDDYVMVRLLDTNAILDAIGKLRAVYPNVLHIERTGLMAKSHQLDLNRDHIKKSELAMFTDFFNQVSGDALTKEQAIYIKDTIQAVHNHTTELSADGDKT